MYQAEGSQPVATASVIQQEPVVLSGTIVNVEQPAPTAYTAQRRSLREDARRDRWRPAADHGRDDRPTVVQPAAPAPAGRWLGGNACGCCDPPGGAALLHDVLVPLRRGRPALAPHRRARRRRRRPGDPRRRDRGGVCPRIHYQRCFVVALPAPNRLAWASRYVFCLPFTCSKIRGGGGGRVPGSPRLFPTCLVFFFARACTPRPRTSTRRWRAPPAVRRATPSPRRALNTRVLCGLVTAGTRWCVPCIAALSCATRHAHEQTTASVSPGTAANLPAQSLAFRLFPRLRGGPVLRFALACSPVL